MGAGEDFFRLNDLRNLRLTWIGFSVEDVNARRAEARYDQITPLDVRMRRIRAQCRTTGIPSKVVQFIARPGHLHLADALPVGGRVGSHIHYGHYIGTPI